MKVLMLGWEFPPHISGGLGTACFGLTKALDELGVKICFVLPQPSPLGATSHVRFRSPLDFAVQAGGQSQHPQKAFHNVELRRVGAQLQAYVEPSSQTHTTVRKFAEQGKSSSQTVWPTAPAVVRRRTSAGDLVETYTGDIMAQVRRYTDLVAELAWRESFDVVHAHDWMTFPAGLAVAAQTGKPLVVHVHSTEFDRSGQNVNQQVYDIERAGVQGADSVICVSQLTRGLLLSRYAARAQKVRVVYNAVRQPAGDGFDVPAIARDEKIVLFLGRVTMQKGPDYFLQAAKKVLEKYERVRFVVAGNGDMFGRTVDLAAAMGIGRYVSFTGFLRGSDVDKVFGMADLYVMPSVSEPFGIAALEALSHEVPVIISKQSGVAEVVRHALKVDFWDIQEMANKIVSVLIRPVLSRTLRENGRIEVGKLSWAHSARKCLDVYNNVAIHSFEASRFAVPLYREAYSASAVPAASAN